MSLVPHSLVIISKSDSPYNVLPERSVEIRAREPNGTSGSLSLIYEDEAGLLPITQPGGMTDDKGVFTFYIENGSYNAVYTDGVIITQPFNTTKSAGTATLSQTKTLTSGQTEVIFDQIQPSLSAFYVNGNYVDKGRIFYNTDYIASGSTVILNNSYPEDTEILGIQGFVEQETEVTSVFGRSGTVTAQSGDYIAEQIAYDNDDSTLVGDTVKEAIDELDSKAMLNYSNINTLKADNPNNETADYTLNITDENKTIWMNSASVNTLTIPTDISVNFAINTIVMVMMEGVGITSVTAVAGVTLNGINGGSGVLTQYSGCTLVKRGANTWIATPLEVA